MMVETVRSRFSELSAYSDQEVLAIFNEIVLDISNSAFKDVWARVRRILNIFIENGIDVRVLHANLSNEIRPLIEAKVEELLLANMSDRTFSINLQDHLYYLVDNINAKMFKRLVDTYSENDLILAREEIKVLFDMLKGEQTEYLFRTPYTGIIDSIEIVLNYLDSVPSKLKGHGEGHLTNHASNQMNFSNTGIIDPIIQDFKVRFGEDITKDLVAVFFKTLLKKGYFEKGTKNIHLREIMMHYFYTPDGYDSYLGPKPRGLREYKTENIDGSVTLRKYQREIIVPPNKSNDQVLIRIES